jgi:hypothetical protein
MESWERINGWLSRLAGQGGYEDSEHSTDSLDESKTEQWRSGTAPMILRRGDTKEEPSAPSTLNQRVSKGGRPSKGAV